MLRELVKLYHLILYAYVYTLKYDVYVKDTLQNPGYGTCCNHFGRQLAVLEPL
jgi:hypothetical protein